MSWRRLLAAGLALAAVAGLIGGAIEWWRFGATTATASRRVEAAVRADFARMSTALSGVAGRIARDPAAAAGLAPGADAARSLFDLVARARGSGRDASEISVTIYDALGTARAWGGRPSDIPSDRIAQPAAFFVKPSPLGLRLVYVLPVQSPDNRRLGAVAAEHVLSPAPAAATITPADYVIATPLAPAALRMRWEGAGDQVRPGAFVLRAPDSSALVEASVAESDIRAARAEHRRRTAATALACFGFTILLLIGPLLDRRAVASQPGPFVRDTGGALGLLAAGTVLLWLAFVQDARQAPTAPVTLLLAGFAAAASVALLAGPVARLRLVARGERRNLRMHRCRSRSSISPLALSSPRSTFCSRDCSMAPSIRCRWISGTSPCIRGACRASCCSAESSRSTRRSSGPLRSFSRRHGPSGGSRVERSRGE